MVATPAEEFQPRFSPDGKEVAYLEERTTLKVLNLASGKSRVVLPGDMNYSYADGDQWYEWSPDGRWFAVQFLSPTRWSSEVGLVPAAGEGELVNLTRSGYEDERPHWARKGEVLLWATDRHGARAAGRAGRASRTSTPRSSPARRGTASGSTRRAYAQLADKEKDAEKDKEKDKGKEKDKAQGQGAKTPARQAGGQAPRPGDARARRRSRTASCGSRCTRPTSPAPTLTPDGETLVYLAQFEKGYDLWKYVPRKKEIKLLAKLDAERSAAFRLDREGKKAFVLADDKLVDRRPRVGQDHAGQGLGEARAATPPRSARTCSSTPGGRRRRSSTSRRMHGVDWAGDEGGLRPLPALTSTTTATSPS